MTTGPEGPASTGARGAEPVRARSSSQTARLTALAGKLLLAPRTPDEAEAAARMAYMEWLSGLNGADSYVEAALAAADALQTAAEVSPASAAFQRLLARSLAAPLTPLALNLPRPTRRGGARARRIPH